VNAGGRLQGRIDRPLTDLGRQQAAAIAGSMPSPVLVVSSPLQRAVETASYFEADVVVDERWTELDYGELDDLPIGDVPRDLWDRWRRDIEFAPPGGESLHDLGERVRAACADLVDRATDHDVVVVSHVSPIKAAVAWALGVGDEISWRMFLDVAAVSRIGFTPRGTSLVGWNDRSHLR
jgi:broad specificity phosphatase PhoE